MKKLTSAFVYIFAAFLAVILVMNAVNLWSGAAVTGFSDVIIGVLYSLLIFAVAICIKSAKNISGKSKIFILLSIMIRSIFMRITTYQIRLFNILYCEFQIFYPK